MAVYDDSDSTTTVNSSYIPGDCRRSEENQNLANREHEKMYKKCKDGFCYCFTSDSDGVRRVVERKKSRRKSGQHNFSPQKQIIAEKNKCIKAISTLEEDLSSDAPMIRIIQQIHSNCVISEVRVNKAHLMGGSAISSKSNRRSCPAAVLKEISETSDVEVETGSEQLTPKKHSERAGKLLEKRLSYSAGQKEKPKKAYHTDVFSTLPKGAPPPKPPRSARSLYSNSKSSDNDDSSQTSSLRKAEKLLNSFLKANGYQVPKYSKNGRQSMPAKSDRDLATSGFESEKVFTNPSCPNLSDFDEVKDYQKSWTTKGKD